MYSSKDAATPYPTQWALNPTAYQNVDSSQVDWAALAQQWIAMKEAAAIVAVPPPPSIKPDTEEGEAPMEVENTEIIADDGPPDAEWNSSTNSWSGNWNQWGWGWPGSGPVDPKIGPNSNITMPPMVDNYPIPSENTAPPMPGYTSAAPPAPTFQHGYWTASQAEQNTSRNNNNSHNRERRSKSKNREYKSSRAPRPQREKPSVMPPVIETMVSPAVMSTSTIDAAKRRQLPAWIREGLEKMEREKQRAVEKEHEKKAREEAEKEKKRLEEEELERLKAEASGNPILPPKSKFESDSETEDMEQVNTKEEPSLSDPGKAEPPLEKETREENTLIVKKSKEEIMQEVMLAVRRSLTEILLEVTDQEIQTVSQEELARYTAAQASRINAMKAGKSKALAAIASGLGLGAYESSSGESSDEEQRNDVTDQQLQDIIRRKRQEFERTARDIEAEVRRAEAKETAEATTPVSTTPERPRRLRSSATPPPADGESPQKASDRRTLKERRPSHKSSDKVDGIKKLEAVNDEKVKKSNKWDNTPSPQPKNANKVNNNKENSSSTSDTEKESSSSSSDSSSESESEAKVESKQAKKRKRRSSSSSDSQRRSKKDKSRKEKPYNREEKVYKSKNHEDYDASDKSKSRRRDDPDRSRGGRDYDKRKYRDGSEGDRGGKRVRRSRSLSYESRSGRKRNSRDRSEERSRRRDKRSYDRESSRRDRDHDRDTSRRDREHDRDTRRDREHDRESSRRDRDNDKHDRYDRYRDHDRRRSRSASHSRHRR